MVTLSDLSITAYLLWVSLLPTADARVAVYRTLLFAVFEGVRDGLLAAHGVALGTGSPVCVLAEGPQCVLFWIAPAADEFGRNTPVELGADPRRGAEQAGRPLLVLFVVRNKGESPQSHGYAQDVSAQPVAHLP